jgi:plastocyanin
MVTNINDRDWLVLYNGREVINMFDEDGSETFDPTECVEVNVGAEFVYVKPGDTITFELI